MKFKKKILSYKRMAIFTFAGLISFALVFLSIFLIVDIIHKVNTKNDLNSKRHSLQREVGFWEEAVRKHKDFRDGYLKLAYLEYRLNEINKSYKYLDKALVLDPNSKKAEELQREIKDK